MKLGTFKVESGRLHISDPCYKKEGRFTLSVPAMNGEWKSSISLGRDGRVTAMTSEVKLQPKMGLTTDALRKSWWMKAGEVGVDSGSMSICDIGFYGKGKEAEGMKQPDWMLKDKKRLKKEKFYGACCELTCGEDQGGVLPHGTVATSGYGDGVYEVSFKMVRGRAIAVKVGF